MKIKVAVLGKNSEGVFSDAQKLVKNLEVEVKNENFSDFEPDITIITDLENEKVLDKTKQIVIANLEDKDLAEELKYLIKEIPVTIVDYNKHQVSVNKAVFQLGLSLNIEPTEILASLRGGEADMVISNNYEN